MTEESSPQPIFHLDLHAWIESQQTAHGVRHDDFGQYHAYCTRRLSRLSHNKETKQYLVCSSKFATTSTTNKQQRSRHAYASRKDDTFANPPQHESVLWYLVVSAERSWAHANLIKRQHGKRQMVLRKLKRASGWANKLKNMASGCTDSVTYMECQAYANWMAANLALEQFDYSVRIGLLFCFSSKNSCNPFFSDTQNISVYTLFRLQVPNMQTQCPCVMN